jgi:hypothetical protein
MKKAQYRKYKEIYKIDLNILKQIIKNCDATINEINKNIDKMNKKQTGGSIIPKISNDEVLYLLIPNLE